MVAQHERTRVGDDATSTETSSSWRSPVVVVVFFFFLFLLLFYRAHLVARLRSTTGRRRVWVEKSPAIIVKQYSLITTTAGGRRVLVPPRNDFCPKYGTVIFFSHSSYTAFRISQETAILSTCVVSAVAYARGSVYRVSYTDVSARVFSRFCGVVTVRTIYRKTVTFDHCSSVHRNSASDETDWFMLRTTQTIWNTAEYYLEAKRFKFRQ